jgi:hypothetical protein
MLKEQRFLKLCEELETFDSEMKIKDVLDSYAQECLSLIKYALDNGIIFHISSEKYKKFSNRVESTEHSLNLEELLFNLWRKEWDPIGGISHIKHYLEKYPEYSDLLFSFLDKKVEIKIKTKIINKWFPGLISDKKSKLYKISSVEKSTDGDILKIYIKHKNTILELSQNFSNIQLTSLSEDMYLSRKSLWVVYDKETLDKESGKMVLLNPTVECVLDMEC